MYMQSRNMGGLGDIDWNSLLKTAVAGYAQVTQVKAAQQQLDLQQQQAKQNAMIYAANPIYSPTYSGTPQTSNMLPLLLIGGVVLLGIFFLKE